MLKKISFILALLALPAAALSAQEQAESSGEETYKSGGNWFLQGGGGVNAVHNISSFPPVGGAAELRAGKWFTPSVGLRAGVSGLRNKPNGTETGWFSGPDPFDFYQADVDLMWCASNTIGGYNPHRFWDISPYLRGGAIAYRQEGDPWGVEPAGGAGVHNGLRLCDRVDLYLEGAVMAAREKAFRQRGTVAFFPTVTAGVVLRVGRQGFRPKEVTKIVYSPVYVRDTVTRVEKEIVTNTQTVVDSVLIQKMRETPLTLYFEIDKTVLTDRELAHLERYASFVLDKDTRVVLVGSADKETGNPEHNQELSEGRCDYVKAILVSTYGLRPGNIECIANGDRKNEFNTPEKNRCVTLTVVREDQVTRTENSQKVESSQ